MARFSLIAVVAMLATCASIAQAKTKGLATAYASEYPVQ